MFCNSVEDNQRDPPYGNMSILSIELYKIFHKDINTIIALMKIFFCYVSKTKDAKAPMVAIKYSNEKSKIWEGVTEAEVLVRKLSQLIPLN